MEIDIDRLAGQLIQEAANRLPPGREHELRIDVTRSLRQLATRIDEGYSIEVHAYTPEEESADGEDVAPDQMADAARQIASRQPNMRRMNLTGRPILELPEADDDDNPAEGEGD